MGVGIQWINQFFQPGYGLAQRVRALVTDDDFVLANLLQNPALRINSFTIFDNGIDEHGVAAFEDNDKSIIPLLVRESFGFTTVLGFEITSTSVTAG
jgi:hypothetical protein